MKANDLCMDSNTFSIGSVKGIGKSGQGGFSQIKLHYDSIFTLRLFNVIETNVEFFRKLSKQSFPHLGFRSIIIDAK